MITFQPYEATCPACEHRWTVEIARHLHVTRLPHLREQLLSGRLQVCACPRCSALTAFESTVVYTDFERHEYVACETAASASWQATIARHQAVFRECFERGPQIARELGQAFKRRLVYGIRALREKVLLWDAGLDDRAVEAVKGDLLRGAGRAPGEAVLRLARVQDGGSLLFSVHDPVRRPDDVPSGVPLVLPLPPTRDFTTAPAALYRARAAEPARITRDYPWLGDGWFVDLFEGPAYLYT